MENEEIEALRGELDQILAQLTATSPSLVPFDEWRGLRARAKELQSQLQRITPSSDEAE